MHRLLRVLVRTIGWLLLGMVIEGCAEWRCVNENFPTRLASLVAGRFSTSEAVETTAVKNFLSTKFRLVLVVVI